MREDLFLHVQPAGRPPRVASLLQLTKPGELKELESELLIITASVPVSHRGALGLPRFCVSRSLRDGSWLLSYSDSCMISPSGLRIRLPTDLLSCKSDKKQNTLSNPDVHLWWMDEVIIKRRETPGVFLILNLQFEFLAPLWNKLRMLSKAATNFRPSGHFCHIAGHSFKVLLREYAKTWPPVRDIASEEETGHHRNPNDTYYIFTLKHFSNSITKMWRW